METKVVSFKNNSLDIRVIVSEETAIARMRRTMVKVQAANDTGEDQDMNILRVVFWPDCIGAAIEYHGFNKPTFEEFCNLPGEFVDNWVDAVWKLIPQWKRDSGILDDMKPEALEKKE